MSLISVFIVVDHPTPGLPLGEPSGGHYVLNLHNKNLQSSFATYSQDFVVEHSLLVPPHPYVTGPCTSSNMIAAFAGRGQDPSWSENYSGTDSRYLLHHN